MATPEMSGTRWRKASRSNGTGGACVEVAHLTTGAVAMRDSKNPSGPIMIMATSTWDAFRTATVAGYQPHRV
jgi:hypothetical protein